MEGGERENRYALRWSLLHELGSTGDLGAWDREPKRGLAFHWADMKMRFLLPLLFIFALGVRAESAKSYQVTGPIVALTDNVITVQKGDERWEIARTPATKADGKLAVGSRVTIHYKMSADNIEVKEAAGKSTDKGSQRASEKAEKKSTR
jgi:hypothetical protein